MYKFLLNKYFIFPTKSPSSSLSNFPMNLKGTNRVEPVESLIFFKFKIELELDSLTHKSRRVQTSLELSKLNGFGSVIQARVWLEICNELTVRA